MKKRFLMLSLLLAGGLMLTVGAGCQRAEEEVPPATTYEERDPGFYEEQAPPVREEEPAAPAYGAPPPSPAEPEPSREPAGGYGL